MKLSYIEHIDEIRNRLFYLLIFAVAVFLVLYDFSGKIFFMFTKFINIALVSISPIDNFLARLKFSIFFSLVLSVPFGIYHVLAFVKPGLSRKRRKMLGMIFLVAVLLFLLSIVFTCFFLLITSQYFVYYNEITGVGNFWSVSKLVGFIFGITLGMILAFQIPLVLFFLRRIGLVNKYFFRKYRKYVYIGWLLLAAIITPPDVITLFLLSIPMILLYELSLFVIK